MACTNIHRYAIVLKEMERQRKSFIVMYVNTVVSFGISEYHPGDVVLCGSVLLENQSTYLPR